MEGAQETIPDRWARSGPSPMERPLGNPIFSFEKIMAPATIFDLLVALLGLDVDEKIVFDKLMKVLPCLNQNFLTNNCFDQYVGQKNENSPCCKAVLIAGDLKVA